MLQAIAACVAGQVRPTDAACRIGGDEFAVILVDCDVRGAFGVVERIVRRLERSALEINEETVPLRVSFGGTGMEIVAGHVYVGGFDLGKTNDAGIHVRVMENLYALSDARLGEAKLRKPLEEYPSQID
ncbi:MAG: diguanylate cyclase [Actinobacteria bacterium]|nr:diguanylate cyclase [Actinomycetota bacterium]